MVDAVRLDALRTKIKKTIRVRIMCNREAGYFTQTNGRDFFTEVLGLIDELAAAVEGKTAEVVEFPAGK